MGPILFVDRTFKIISASESAKILLDLDLQGEALLSEMVDIRLKNSTQGAGDLLYSVPDSSGELVINFRGSELPAKIFILPPSAEKTKALIYIDGKSPVEGQSQIDNQSQLIALGTLAGSIAHDLNNLLMAVLGHLSYLRLTSIGEIDDSLRSAEEGAKKAAELSKQIIEFAKIEAGTLGTTHKEDLELSLDICELTKSSIPMLSPNLPVNISINLKCPDQPLFVKAKDSQITQILLNLIVNARDAMPKGGAISIEISPIRLSEPKVIHGFSLSVGSYARVIVSDVGEGMSKDVQAKMFEPFFTTKKGTGTGLGLATVFVLIKSLNGAIDVKSVDGKGSSFSIVIPLSDSQEIPILAEPKPNSYQSQPMNQELQSKGSRRILVVDDEDAVRLVLEKSLELLGYSTIGAENGAKAVEIFKTESSSIDLVVMDMIMPGIPGSELFYLLKEIKPDVKVLISSGYSSDQKTKQLLTDGALGLIQKPFSVEELLDKVKGLLS